MFENHLLYTIVFMILLSATYFLWFHQKIKELGLLILILMPLVFIGCYMAFAIMYMIADTIFGDTDLLVTHLVTNIPNFYALYLFIRTLKENKQTKG